MEVVYVIFWEYDEALNIVPPKKGRHKNITYINAKDIVSIKDGNNGQCYLSVKGYAQPLVVSETVFRLSRYMDGKRAVRRFVF